MLWGFVQLQTLPKKRSQPVGSTDAAPPRQIGLIALCPCLQGTSGPDPTTVYVDMRALRHDRYCEFVFRHPDCSAPLEGGVQSSALSTGATE